MKVRDLNLTASSAKVDCLGSVIRVKSSDHKKGRGWTPGDYTTLVGNGGVTLGEGGAILWPAGMFFSVR